MRKLAEWILEFPKTLLGIFVFCAIVSAYLTAKIPFDFSTESLFVSNDPQRRILEKFKKIYGNDDNFIFIAFEHPHLFKLGMLEKIRELEKDLEEVEEVEQTFSLVDVVMLEEVWLSFEEVLRSKELVLPREWKEAEVRLERLLEDFEKRYPRFRKRVEGILYRNLSDDAKKALASQLAMRSMMPGAPIRRSEIYKQVYRQLPLKRRQKILREILSEVELAPLLYYSERRLGKVLERILRQRRLPRSQKRLERIRPRVLKNRLYAKNIVSEDGKSTGILLILNPHLHTNAKRVLVIKKIQAVLDKDRYQELAPFYLAGIPVVRTEYARLISRDHLTFLPIILPLFCLFLYVNFRNFFQMVVPLLVVGASVVWTLGFMQLMGESINILSNVIYVLILVIGVASSIHVITCYNTELAAFKNKREAVISTMVHMGKACFFTCFTTAIGFLSLAVTDIRIIRSFGIFSAIGVMLTFVAAAFLLPMVLFFLPLPNLRRQEQNLDHRLIKRILWKVGYFNSRYPYLLVGFIFLLTLFWIYFILFYLVIDTHMLEEVSETNPVVLANHFVEKKLAGVLPLEILLKEKQPSLLKRPEELRKLEAVQEYIRQKKMVSTVVSFVDLVKMANDYLSGHFAGGEKVPEDPALISKLYHLLERFYQRREFGVRLHHREGEKLVLRITARLRDDGSNAHFALIQDIERKMREYFPSERYEIIFTGEPHMASVLIKRLVHGMLSSIFLAAGIICIVILIIFRSWKLALLSMVPNIIPIIFTLGMMGLFGFVLRTSTVVIFSIALGIAVDDTIHYLIRYKHMLQRGLGYKRAMFHTLLTTGKAMIWTSIVICSGLFVLITSSFLATSDFGILGSITLLSALLGDLVLLPVLLLIFRPRM
ncbi:MAG: hypothetical protein D6805_06250 [Planctomycetota bacterium]|nr:MAG: hypothetical protein D6805_06250 [Planctomycetota bacterium]